MKRSALFGALTLLAALPAVARADGASLAETAGARFPDRAYVLSLEEPRPLTSAEVHVTENGKPVSGAAIAPPDRAGARRFGVVLAIDTSYSMRGRPLRAAVTAAREFVRLRAPDQPVALLAFAGTVDVVLPFSTDQAALERALDEVRQGGGGSRLVDAAGQAVAMVRAAGMTSGSAVLISDGADRGSSAALDSVAAAARSAGARVYGIGLSSRNDDFSALNLLAARSAAEFTAVSSLADLARVYRRLGSRLAHQYVLRYRSAADPGKLVRVKVTVDGIAGAAVTRYRTPAAPVTVRKPFHHAPAERLWLHPAAAGALIVLVAALLFAGLWFALRPRSGGVRERMAPYVTPPEDPTPERRGGTQLTGKVLRDAERRLDGREWWERFRETLDVGRISIAPVRLLAGVAVGTVITLLLAPMVFGGPVFALLALAVPGGAWAYIRRQVATQRKHFVDQLPDNLQVIASAMRAGHSFAGALSVVVEDAPEPTRRELRRVIADERLGVPLDVAMGAAVRRMESKDLEQVALVAVLQRETGGNTAEVLDRVTDAVRQRLALRRLVGSLTAQGRMSRWVLTGIPVFLVLALSVLNPEYLSPLFETTLGHVLLAVSAVMVTAGSLVIKKIVDIKV